MRWCCSTALHSIPVNVNKCIKVISFLLHTLAWKDHGYIIFHLKKYEQIFKTLKITFLCNTFYILIDKPQLFKRAKLSKNINVHVCLIVISKIYWNDWRKKNSIYRHYPFHAVINKIFIDDEIVYYLVKNIYQNKWEGTRGENKWGCTDPRWT